MGFNFRTKRAFRYTAYVKLKILTCCAIKLNPIRFNIFIKKILPSCQ